MHASKLEKICSYPLTQHRLVRGNFPTWLIAMDEFWIYYYGIEDKLQNKILRLTISENIKKGYANRVLKFRRRNFCKFIEK